jgi:glycosyltransferase involved in cell wall biosynthesis
MSRPLHIGHVVRAMNHGGVETWLMMLLQKADPARLRFTFLTQVAEPAAFDDEIRRLGGAIVPVLEPHRPWRYARDFRRALATHGPFDVVHSHVHHYSGFVCKLARDAGVPVRIAHGHTDDRSLQAAAGPLRRGYLWLAGQLLRRHASRGLAASERAACALFGADWQQQPRRQLLFAGIDTAPFRAPRDAASARAALGLSSDAFVVCHVGRFVAVKNHSFLVRAFAELARTDAHAVLLLVGDGPLRPQIEAQVRAAGLADRVRFAGVRGDVPHLLAGAADAFVLPSLFEGLPMVALEAQAAGLPCLLSDGIARETAVVPGAVRWLALTAGPGAWAEALAGLRRVTRTPDAALACMEASAFDIRTSLRHLEKAYADAG